MLYNTLPKVNECNIYVIVKKNENAWTNFFVVQVTRGTMKHKNKSVNIVYFNQLILVHDWLIDKQIVHSQYFICRLHLSFQIFSKRQKVSKKVVDFYSILLILSDYTY